MIVWQERRRPRAPSGVEPSRCGAANAKRAATEPRDIRPWRAGSGAETQSRRTFVVVLERQAHEGLRRNAARGGRSAGVDRARQAARRAKSNSRSPAKLTAGVTIPLARKESTTSPRPIRSSHSNTILSSAIERLATRHSAAESSLDAVDGVRPRRSRLCQASATAGQPPPGRVRAAPPCAGKAGWGVSVC